MNDGSADLRRFLHPRVVAVIGVSQPGRPGYSLFQKIRAKVEAEGGKVISVNPKLTSIDGLTAYPSINDIPEPVDLAVIMISDVLAALRDCVAKRPAFVVIFTAGFAETGVPGARLQEEIATIARDAGFPVAMKISSVDIAHKSDAGLVRLNVGSVDDVAHAFADLMECAQRTHPAARLDGVLVQEMVTDGVETLLGLSRDPILGPIVVFGLGGIFVEVLKDVAMRTVPLTRRDAGAMVREIRGFALLDGARGRPQLDVAALVDAICAVAALADVGGDRLRELDINPLIVLPAGRGVKAADALAVLR